MQLIYDEALKGRVYVGNQFAEKFENKAGLGCKTTIVERVSVLATKGYIKFSRNLSEFALQNAKSKYGVLCVEGMLFKNQDENLIPVLPTHFKCSNGGAVLPVENPAIWILHDDEVQS